MATWLSSMDARGLNPTRARASKMLPVPPQSSIAWRRTFGQARRVTDRLFELRFSAPLAREVNVKRWRWMMSPWENVSSEYRVVTWSLPPRASDAR